MKKINKIDEFFEIPTTDEKVCEELFIDQMPTEWIEGSEGKHKLNLSILDAVKRMFEEDALTYPVIKLNFTKENVSVIIDIQRKKVDYAISKVMKWALDNEYYEICQEIKELSEKYDLIITDI
jgi:hypothetical protein